MPTSASEYWMIPADTKNVEKPTIKRPRSPTSLVSKLEADIKMLETGSFSDCTVISGTQTWKTHKVILSRCPYFAGAFSSSNGFKEAIESKITIQNFEPFEVSWLLQYIYGSRIDIEEAKETSPSKSFLETCTLLWGIGDFFRLEDLTKSILLQLQNRCKALLLETRCASTMLKKIDFLPDLEAAIRAAWRHDRVTSPVRQDIISLCVGIHPFVRDYESFIGLLDQMPEFTAQYLKALLGCPGMQSVETHFSFQTACHQCRGLIFDSNGANVSDEAFVWTPTSLNFWDNYPNWFCSRACYRSRVEKWS